jgi:hypothetical protein
MIIAMLQKSAPDISDFTVFLLFLLCFLFVLLLINNLFDWVRSKPWKRDKPPEQDFTEGETTNISPELPHHNPEETDHANEYMINGTPTIQLADKLIILKHT